jgi:hypothetical protein
VKVEERSRSSVLKLFRVSQKGGDLEEGWLERRFFRNSRPKRRLRISSQFIRTERRRADLHPYRRLLTDVVPEALREEPGLQPSSDPGPGVTVKFVNISLRAVASKFFHSFLF